MMRAVIADDERLARDRLRRLLKDHPDVEIAGVAANGASAAEMILEQSPDLVFLDIQMPGLDGFDVLAAIEGIETPEIIFTTAFDSYAVRAFEEHAVDYLLKPFDEERLADAVERARRLRPESAQRARGLLDSIASGFLQRVPVREPGRITFVEAPEIDWIEAAGNYVYLHCGKRRHLVRGSLHSFEKRLDPARFARVHRTAIVNREKMREIVTDRHGDAVVVLTTGARVPASRRYRRRL